MKQKILAHSSVRMEWVREVDGRYWWHLIIETEPYIFSQISTKLEAYEEIMDKKASFALRSAIDVRALRVFIVPQLSEDTDWRTKTLAFVDGQNITNQGRVHSDNIASVQFEGLLFRSPPEVELFKALKQKGIPIAPLPVLIRGGEPYKRIEPDFVIFKDGIVLVVEVDGDTIHRETPTDATQRLAMLEQEGARIYRIKASECNTPELAKKCADDIIQRIAKYKSSK
jgi:hypothetical protein